MFQQVSHGGLSLPTEEPVAPFTAVYDYNAFEPHDLLMHRFGGVGACHAMNGSVCLGARCPLPRRGHYTLVVGVRSCR